MPLASLFLLIFIDPVVSEAISRIKSRRTAADTVQKIANEHEKSSTLRFSAIRKPALYFCH